MLISQGSFRVCKNNNVILLILLTLLEKLVTLLNLLKKSTTYKNFTWALVQVCHVHPTPMGPPQRGVRGAIPQKVLGASNAFGPQILGKILLCT